MPQHGLVGARAYHVMGRVHSLSGRYRDALASNQRALDIENAYGAPPREKALELNELGIDYRHLGRFTDAVAAYDSAIKVNRRLGNPGGIALVEFNLATIRMDTGESDEALILLDDALGWFGQTGDVRGLAFIHGGLADLYIHAHAYKPAREHLEKALAINRLAKLPYGEVANLERDRRGRARHRAGGAGDGRRRRRGEGDADAVHIDDRSGNDAADHGEADADARPRARHTALQRLDQGRVASTPRRARPHAAAHCFSRARDRSCLLGGI